MEELEKIINKPICVHCEHEWQKGYAVSQFNNCDNPFRLNDFNFKYIHFRTFKNCTFYSDKKGPSRKERESFEFNEIFQVNF